LMEDNDILINKCFRKYLFPSILALLGGNISIMIDNIIAGSVIGSDALAATSLVYPVFFIWTTLGMLVNAGAASLASVAIGKNDKKTTNRLFTLAILLSLVLGGMVSVLTTVFLAPLTRSLGADGNLYGMVYDYCRILCPGGLGIILLYLPLNFFRIQGRARLGMAIFIIMAALDIALDLLFVLVFNMGMAGLALATVLSALIAVALVAPFLFFKDDAYQVVAVRDALKLVKAILKTGSPLALGNFYSMVRLFLLNMIILAVGGPVAVACFSFANSFNVMAQAFVSGIAQTVSPLVGVFYGELDLTSVKKVVKLALKFGLGAMTAFFLLTLLFAKPICLLFGLNAPEQLQVAIPAVIICAFSLTGAMGNNVFIYYYLTIGRTGLANLITLFRGLVLAVLLAFLFSKIMGLYGVWFSFTVSEVATFLILWATVRRTLAKEPDLQGILLINQNSVANGQSLSFSVANNTEAIMGSSEKIGEFCESAALTPKQALMVSLAIEEILLLLTEHAFQNGNKHFVDVRIYVGNDDIIMRFRCDGQKFNPITYYQTELQNVAELNLGDSMGLQLISKSVKQVEYTTNFGLNNLIIKI
jgi:putative MATE family efflux protein